MAEIPTADVYIGGEPYDVLDDVKMLRHVPCGTPLAGDGAISAHVCPSDLNDDADVQVSGSTPEPRRPSSCPLGCGYAYPIAACVRLHLIQHHNYGYDEAQETYPDE